VPVTAGLFTLLGVSLSQLVTLRLERERTGREEKRQKVEDEHRWDKDVRDAYARFGAAAQSFRHVDVSGGQSNIADLVNDIERKLSAVRLTLQHIEFMGQFDVINAARVFYHRAEKLSSDVRFDASNAEQFDASNAEQFDASSAERARSLLELARSYRSFTNAARGQFGLPPISELWKEDSA
jgi:hypothetical protein